MNHPGAIKLFQLNSRRHSVGRKEMWSSTSAILILATWVETSVEFLLVLHKIAIIYEMAFFIIFKTDERISNLHKTNIAPPVLCLSML